MLNKIKDIIAALPALQGDDEEVKLYPVTVLADSIIPPLACYSTTGPDAFRSFSGKVHHYSGTFTLDILCETYDECGPIYNQAEQAVMGQIIFGQMRKTCSCPELDAFVPELGLYRKRMVFSVDWRP